MAKAMAKVEIEIPDDGRDMFVVVDGVKIAMRGRPGTPRQTRGFHWSRAGACSTVARAALVRLR
jgi:hypothetical protein